MDANETDFIEGGNYISLATRKRSGEWVATPVWFAPDKGSYYVFSAGDAGSDSRIAACTVTGALTGELHDSRAYVLDKPAEETLALAALRRKYGWQMLLADFFSNLTGKMKRRVYVRIDP